MIVRLVNIVLGAIARDPFVAEVENNIGNDITRIRIKPQNAIGNCLKQKRASCHDALMVHKRFHIRTILNYFLLFLYDDLFFQFISNFFDELYPIIALLFFLFWLIDLVFNQVSYFILLFFLLLNCLCLFPF